jgi:hypothetical protein
MRVELDVLHAVVAGSAGSLGWGSGVACRSQWLAAVRAPMCVEVGLLHVVVTDKAW